MKRTKLANYPINPTEKRVNAVIEKAAGGANEKLNNLYADYFIFPSVYIFYIST